VSGAIVVAIAIQGTTHPALNTLPIVFLAARIGQTLVESERLRQTAFAV
jgi:hypothetical protein